MASARSLAALCRATFSLCSAASTSAGPAALGAGLLRAAAAGGAAAAPALQQQQACAAAGLRQLVRHFHSSLASGAAAEEGGASPAINPLQQAPMPAATPSRPDFGLGPLAAAEEGGNTSRAVSRGISISPQVRRPAGGDTLFCCARHMPAHARV